MHRRSALIAAFLVLLLLLSACTAKPERSQPQPVAAGNGDLVTVRVGIFDFGPYTAVLDNVIAGFQNVHPQYRVEKVPLKSDRASDIRPLIQEGKLDVTSLNLVGVELTSQLTDLEPYLRRSNFDLEKLGVGVGQIQWQGRITSLPLTAMPRTLVANTDLFKQAGVPLPQAGWTWEEFRETAGRLTKGDGANKQWGLGPNSAELLAQSMLLQTTGARPAWKADADAVRNALQFWSTMVHTDRSVPAPPKSKQGPLQRGWEEELFWRGQAAMSLQSIGPGISEGTPPVPFAVLPVPVSPGNKASSYVWFWSLGMPSNAANPEAAWAFVQYAAGPEGALIQAQHGLLPMYMTAEAQEAWVRRVRIPGAEHVVKTRWAGHFGNSGGGQGGDDRLSEVLNQAVNQALSGALPWEEAAADFNELAKTYR